MRRILVLVALAISAWYLSNRQRRNQLRGRWQDMVSSLLGAHRKAGTATPGEMATTARARVADVRSQAAVTADTVADTARRASDVTGQKAQEATSAAAQSAGDAAGNIQEAPGANADRVGQAAEPATDIAPEPAEPAAGVTPEAAEPAAGVALGLVEPTTGVAVEPVRPATDVAPGPSEPATDVAPERAGPLAGVTTEPAAASAAPSSIHTDVDTPPPSVHETMQAGLADIDDRVRDLSARAAPESEPAEQGAVRSEDAATSGTLGDEAMAVGAVDVVTDVGGMREDEATQEGSAPEGQRPRPGAGAGTTTPTGGPVEPLSPIGGAPTSTGVPEPLPPELTPGEPGAGGPAGSSRAPSRPDRAETPTTGMEQPPVVDRAAEAARRTSGQFVGNKSTRVYHAATSGNLPSERHRVYFETEQEAMAAGFRPARHEGPPGGGARRTHR